MTQASRRRLADRRRRRRQSVHARALSEEHRLIAQTAEEFVDNEVMPVSTGSRARTGRWRERSCNAAASSGCSAPTCPRRTAASALDKASSLLVGEAVGRVRLVRDDLRRADRPGDHSDPLLRHRGTEARYLPASSAARSSAPMR